MNQKQSTTTTWLSVVFFCLSLTTFSQVWKSIQATNEPLKRHECALTAVGNQWILLGGRGIKPLNLYDPVTNTWKNGAVPPLEIHHFQSVTLNGLLYVAGAFTGGYPFETPIPNILIYDPVQNLWTIGPVIPAHRRRGAAGCVVHQGKLYLVCGIINGHTSGWVNWMDEFDPKTGQWRELPDAPRSRDHVQVAIIENKLYVAGGRRSGFSGEVFKYTVPETDIFDFGTQKWKTLPSPDGDIPTPRAGCTATAWQDNLVVLGGESTTQPKAHASVEMLDTHTQKWIKLPNLQTGRHGTQVMTFGNNMVIGAGSGNRGGNPELSTFEVYLPDSTQHLNWQGVTLKPGVLKSTADSLVFVRSKKMAQQTLTLQNTEGNQGLLISYAIASGNPAYKLAGPLSFPIILAPNESITLLVQYFPNADTKQDGLLLIGPLKGKPVSVKLKAK